MGEQIRVADEVRLATATLHRRHPRPDRLVPSRVRGHPRPGGRSRSGPARSRQGDLGWRRRRCVRSAATERLAWTSSSPTTGGLAATLYPASISSSHFRARCFNPHIAPSRSFELRISCVSFGVHSQIRRVLRLQTALLAFMRGVTPSRSPLKPFHARGNPLALPAEALSCEG